MIPEVMPLNNIAAHVSSGLPAWLRMRLAAKFRPRAVAIFDQRLPLATSSMVPWDLGTQQVPFTSVIHLVGHDAIRARIVS